MTYDDADFKLDDEGRERMKAAMRAAMAARAKANGEDPAAVSDLRAGLRLAGAILAILTICVGGFFAWRWFEGYRASIWAEEMRKAGVAAPAEVR